jgi:hydrogenase maturation protein HypF
MYKIFIKGIIQGVGFRPYIYKKAKEHQLVGSVKNTGNGVEIIVNDKDFIHKLTDLPPLAKISSYTTEKVETKKCFSDFSILKSTTSKGETSLPPDIFMCPDCLRELRETTNRRYNYYFITCTNCGPRFSMIENYPYDRPLTSMNDFKMCLQCQKEYVDPLNRRYHAQTIACKDCGPKLKLLYKKYDSIQEISGSSDIMTIKKSMDLLKSGEIISIKGVGGFHTCSLCDERSVKKIRNLFHRLHKPYAVMVKDIPMAQQIGILSTKEKELLLSPQRPIIVVKKKQPNSFTQVTELDSIGIMLPYTALHHLLFDFINEPLVMTSCNIPGEPVSITETLGNYFLTHERRIVNRCDDSVIKINHDHVFFLRRSRGYTPLPVRLPINCLDTIAVGAELNNVICTTKKQNCFLSQYIGDTSKYETYQFFKDTILKMIQLTRLKPRLIVCDLHPNYNSALFARELAEQYNTPLVKIQHHKAHIASVAAEHSLTDYVGIAMDGLGYGDDGKLWGGEVFRVNQGNNFTRVGHLEEQPQLGGDSATLFPKKMLFGILSKIYDEKQLMQSQLFTHEEIQLFLQMIHDNFNVQQTTSTGRILDATAALLGFCDLRTYDGRPAMILESLATSHYKFEPVFTHRNGTTSLMTTPLFEFLLSNTGKDKRRLAATTQRYLVKGLYDIAQNTAEKENLPIVASGGVMYNEMISSFLLQQGVFTNKELPVGDGCICYGQAYLANMN